MDGNVDRTLLAHWERSWNRERQARLTLPPAWLDEGRDPATELAGVFDDVLARARARIRAERAALADAPPDEVC